MMKEVLPQNSGLLPQKIEPDQTAKRVLAIWLDSSI
jgi:hypothetical protein